MKISDNNLLKIKEIARKDSPNECCGFILKDGKVIELKNLSEDPKNSFVISHENHKRFIGQIEYFFHSHEENATFSEIDKSIAEKFKYKAVVYAVKDDSFNFYEPQDYEVPYLGRPFLLGIMDCLELVRDYYRREFNIHLPEFIYRPREIFSDWKNLPENNPENKEFEKYFIANGFSLVTESKKFDVFISKAPGLVCGSHCGLFIEKNQVLHHPPGRPSENHPFSGWIKERLTSVLRHSSLC